MMHWHTDTTFSMAEVVRGGAYHDIVFRGITKLQNAIRKRTIGFLTWTEIIEDIDDELKTKFGIAESFLKYDRVRGCRQECIEEQDVNTAAMTTWYLFHSYHDLTVPEPKRSPHNERILQPYCD